MDDKQKVAQMLLTVAKMMVDHPDEVSVETVDMPLSVMYRLKVAPSDRGKLIGQGGRTARSLRIVLQAVGMTTKMRIGLDISE
jgi:hypothetical protein